MVMTCTEFKELVAAYALGALTAEQRAACDRHLAEERHDGCIEALRAANDAAALLGRALSPIQPSPGLWWGIERRIGAAARPRRASAWVGWVAAAAAIAALVWVARDRHRLQTQLAEVEAARGQEVAQRTSCETGLMRVERDAQQQRHVLDVLPQAGARLIALAPLADGKALGKVVFDPEDRKGYFVGHGLQAPSGKDYELWLIRGEQKIAAGLLRGAPQGALVAAIDPGLLAGAPPDAIAVTLEPAGGGTAPTGPIVLVGKI
jgi:anti-sigma-K factor RskA